MVSPLPPLNALRAFEAAARLGSFKAAATEAGVTPGAISRHIRHLEDWLGAALFERHNRRVILTAAGRAYVSDLSTAFAQLGSATEQFKSRLGRRLLRVNALSTFTMRWLLPRLAGFRARHPDIDVQLTTSNDPVDTIGEACEVIIRGGPDTFYGYMTLPFLPENRRPVCSPELLERQPLGCLEDLHKHTFLHASSMRRLWAEWLAKAGVEGLEPAGNLVLDHFYLTIEAALGGLGIAMGPTALIAGELCSGKLVAPFPEPVLPARTYCAYVTHAASRDAAIRAFCTWLEAEGSGSWAP